MGARSGSIFLRLLLYIVNHYISCKWCTEDFISEVFMFQRRRRVRFGWVTKRETFVPKISWCSKIENGSPEKHTTQEVELKNGSLIRAELDLENQDGHGQTRTFTNDDYWQRSDERHASRFLMHRYTSPLNRWAFPRCHHVVYFSQPNTKCEFSLGLN